MELRVRNLVGEASPGLLQDYVNKLLTEMASAVAASSKQEVLDARTDKEIASIITDVDIYDAIELTEKILVWVLEEWSLGKAIPAAPGTAQ